MLLRLIVCLLWSFANEGSVTKPNSDGVTPDQEPASGKLGIPKRLLPWLILACGALVAGILILLGPDVQPRVADSVAPLVRVAEVDPQTYQYSVHTHGTVVPRTESNLVVEVDGKVVTISPALVAGGFFAAGDVLLEIEALDYRTRLSKARAFLDRSTSDLDNAQKNHKRQERLLARGAVSDAHLDDAFNRLKIAEATLQEAKANVSQAERDLARTKIMAPFDGRVRSERVDVGQFVRRGDQVGTIYATDYAEVRLPIHDDELAFLDIPLLQHEQELATYPDVTLSANFAGDRRQWRGQVVRTEGELDPDTRMIHVVARVAEPYGNTEGQSGEIAPLSIGLFVDAEIHGRTEPNVTVLPRTALRDDNQLLIVDSDNKLRFREVEVLRVNGSNIYVGKGINPGDRVCLSAMQSSQEGMLVRVVDEEDSVRQPSSDTAL